MLLVAILGGGDAVNTFNSGDSFGRTKAYMTFILAFVAITTAVVSIFWHAYIKALDTNRSCAAIFWLHDVPRRTSIYRLIFPSCVALPLLNGPRIIIM